MTEQEWLAAADPRLITPRLATLVSPRKMRLFGCACRTSQDVVTAFARSANARNADLRSEPTPVTPSQIART